MKWIKYKVVQSTIDDEVICIDKKIGYNEANLAIAQEEAYNGEYQITEDDETFEKEPLSVEFGGTGAITPEAARSNLGAIGVSDVVDNLESDSSNLPLSAKQGKLLNQSLISKPNIFYGTTEPSADLGKDGDLYFQYEDGE